MNPTLVAAVKQRMRERPTEALLEIWVQNDRACWSEAAIEAARQLLLERQVELPKQAEAATRKPAAAVEIDDFLLGFLRVVLWIGVVLGCVDLAYQGIQLWWWTGNDDPIDRLRSAGAMWLTPALLMQAVFSIGFPLLLVLAAIGCMKLRRRARVAMLVYAWAALGLGAWSAGNSVLWLTRTGSTPWPLREAVTAVYGSIYCVVILWIMTRPLIKNLFEPELRGFEPLPSGSRLDVQPTTPERSPEVKLKHRG